MDKTYADMSSAMKGVLFDNITIMSGGFGICGIPENALGYISKSGVKNLTFISNNPGTDEFGIGLLCKNKQVRRLIVSYLGTNKAVEEAFMHKELEIDLVPQGTLSARMHSAGAGIPAFYTRTGYGTVAMEGKEIRYFNGVPYLMEEALYADLAIIRGYKADRYGNLTYRKSARNFNPVMATASTIVIAEVEEILDVGEIGSDNIHTPGIFVDRVVKCNFEKRIEQRTVR